jgi:hypothetical protein
VRIGYERVPSGEEALPLFVTPEMRPPSRVLTGGDFLNALGAFSFNGKPTVERERAALRYFVNEFWTSGQRQAHSIHEISYRACFKPQLPQFFIERLTGPGDTVYDPFSGRGTTAVQTALMARRPVANDINPLSEVLVRPRLDPPCIEDVRVRLAALDLSRACPAAAECDLLVFYHPDTLRQICALRDYVFERRTSGRLDKIDEWIRMVAINRLTGHSTGFFSVYTLPPNQAVSVGSQLKINAARKQVPPYRDVAAVILKKTKSLLDDGLPPEHPPGMLLTGPAYRTPRIGDGEIDLVVTSPPFLDIVDYEGDNWLRCWFAGIDAKSVLIDRYKDIRSWESFVRETFIELARVVRPGGVIAFEVGEIRGGKVLLEHHVVDAIRGLPFTVLAVMVNQQQFTKTANCWGVSNNTHGTNTNRIVVAERTG